VFRFDAVVKGLVENYKQPRPPSLGTFIPTEVYVRRRRTILLELKRFQGARHPTMTLASAQTSQSKALPKGAFDSSQNGLPGGT
jgi:hypothetical protein